jgi:hypothetical protein
MQNRSFDNLLYVEVVENFILSKIAGLSVFVGHVDHVIWSSKVGLFFHAKNRQYTKKFRIKSDSRLIHGRYTTGSKSVSTHLFQLLPPRIS